ncbi:NifB/NifX family molybdenum-iron cluster-binding protein [Propionivibrio soli]|uniref:NifB/NifX family molybdenum-iron cluster-binding protein n=1 Tax=Propionivibrio soli TaxID=2976531 RepID=UPI0021E7B53B|nr:NifB/NifX family molybdenum-iron cluster-binding protein [Propionivibrio soli]
MPIRAPGGLQAEIEPHLPNAEYLLFFDTESRHFHEVCLRDQKAGSGADLEIHAVLCGSINRVTLRSLSDQGIKVYGIEATTVGEAIAHFERAGLANETASQAAGGCCGGHGHGHHGASGHDGAGCGGHGGCGGGCGGHGHGHDHAHGEESDRGGCGSGGHGAGHEGDHQGHHHDGHHEHGSGGCCGGHGRKQGNREAEVPPLGRKVKVAVCSQNRKTVTDHAGKCRKFWVYDIADGRIVDKSLLELPLDQTFHETPPGAAHPLDAIDVLIAAGMSPGLQYRLLGDGIRSVVTELSEPDEAVADVLAQLGYGEVALPAEAS